MWASVVSIISALLGLLTWFLKRQPEKSVVDTQLERRRKARQRVDNLKKLIYRGNTRELKKEIDGLLIELDIVRRLRRPPKRTTKD